MTLSFKKWLEVGGGLEPVKQDPDVPFPGEKWTPGQTHAMSTYSAPGSRELPPTKKHPKCKKK